MRFKSLLKANLTIGTSIFRQNCHFQNYPRSLSTLSNICLCNKFCDRTTTKPNFNTSLKYYTTENETGEKKLGLVARFKQMYRDYWYVLVPVHLITSIGWFTGFYYVAKSGVDVASLLENWGVSDRISNYFKDSSMGYVAVSYGLYKVATPLRYTVTLGGTTISIKYLTKYGYIKPVPSKEKLKQMYREKKDNMKNTFNETKEELRYRKNQLKERKDNIIGDYTNFKKELKDIKSK